MAAYMMRNRWLPIDEHMSPCLYDSRIMNKNILYRMMVPYVRSIGRREGWRYTEYGEARRKELKFIQEGEVERSRATDEGGCQTESRPALPEMANRDRGPEGGQWQPALAEMGKEGGKAGRQ